MLDITDNIAAVIQDLENLPGRIQASGRSFFARKENDLYTEARAILEQVVYLEVPETEAYTRRGTSTSSLGILNSLVVFPTEEGGVTIGITSESSAAADTIPVTNVGKAFSDTYAAYMITGGGFLAMSNVPDVRNFLEAWARYFEITIPYEYFREVVVKSV